MQFDHWVNEFSVGHPQLDGQHIALFDLCKRAASCLDSHVNTDAELCDILEHLISYTTTHFADEERLLQSCNYPHFSKHRAEHVEYRMKLMELLLDAGNGKVDKHAIFDNLSHWWAKHILSADKDYAAYVCGTGN